MSQGVQLIVFPVKDIPRAKALYGTLLGAEPYADAPYYVGFKVGGQEIGLDPNGHRQGLTGPIPYWEVEDVKTSLQSLLDAGAEVQQDVKDVGRGKLVAIAKDADGNLIGLTQSPQKG
ncbi:MAG TPA: VOC family protein [Candidatus Dormibacteraeota bacterium]